MIEYLSFSDLFLLSIFSRFIYVATNGSISFFYGWVILHRMYTCIHIYHISQLLNPIICWALVVFKRVLGFKYIYWKFYRWNSCREFGRLREWTRKNTQSNKLYCMMLRQLHERGSPPWHETVQSVGWCGEREGSGDKRIREGMEVSRCSLPLIIMVGSLWVRELGRPLGGFIITRPYLINDQQGLGEVSRVCKAGGL